MPHNELRELDAWLYFLGSDNPADVQRIVYKYPFFQELYQDIIRFRYQPKEVISMYSEALAIMDKNTVEYMIDKMRAEMKAEMKAEIRKKDLSLQQKNRSLQQINRSLQQKEHKILEQANAIQQKDELIRELQNRLMHLEQK